MPVSSSLTVAWPAPTSKCFKILNYPCSWSFPPFLPLAEAASPQASLTVTPPRGAFRIVGCLSPHPFSAKERFFGEKRKPRSGNVQTARCRNVLGMQTWCQWETRLQRPLLQPHPPPASTVGRRAWPRLGCRSGWAQGARASFGGGRRQGAERIREQVGIRGTGESELFLRLGLTQCG